MAVSVATVPTFAVGLQVALFEVRVPSGSFFPYDVAQDGRFLVNSLDESSVNPSGPMTVVLNWAVGPTGR